MNKRYALFALILTSLFLLSACQTIENDISQAPTESAPSPAAAGYKNITPDKIGDLTKDGVRLVDVRTAQEYENGHIPGAETAPLDQLPQAAAAWDKKEPVIVICLSGGRSAQAASYLAKEGFKKIYNVEGGMMRYDGPRETGNK